MIENTFTKYYEIQSCIYEYSCEFKATLENFNLFYKAQRVALATKLMRVVDDIMHFWSNNTRTLTNTNITIITKNIGK